MLKIFLTGDAHIGLQYPSWRRGTILAEARLDVFSNMVNTANDEGCNLFVIAGDLFESNDQCSRGEVQKLLDILSQFQGAVAILPGNHDYYDPKVPLWQYLREIAAAKNNILLLTNNQPYPVRVGEEWAAFYPAPCRSQHSVNGENNLAWIKAEEIPDDCNYRIGVAHGTLRGEALDNENLYFPMGLDELNRIPMDVWLLGHVHVPFPRILRADSYTEGERIFNAGTPVQTHHNCNTEGCAFIIRVTPDKRVSAKKVVVGPYRFFARNINLEAGRMKAGLAAQLRNIPDNSVVDLRLFGAVSAEEYDHRVEIVEAATYRFFEVNYASFSLTRMLSQEDIKKNFPETSFPAQLLNALMAEPKEAQMVFELLASLKGGSSL